MSKRLFQILDEMNKGDIDNETQNLRISNTLVEGRKVKQGGLITMGADEQTLLDLLSGSHMAILIVIDKKEYKTLVE